MESLAITKDNQYIISGGRDKTVIIWSLEGKTLEALLESNNGSVNALAITSDSRYIVSSGTDKLFYIWSLQDELQVASFQGTFVIRSTAITIDNKFCFSYCGDNFTIIWNLHDQKLEGIFPSTNPEYFEWKVKNLEMIDFLNI